MEYIDKMKIHLVVWFLVQSLHFSISTFLKTDCKTMCKGDKRTLNVYYKDILEAQKNNTLIIDVREQSEIDETGKLPGSIHIPSVYNRQFHYVSGFIETSNIYY